MSYGILALPSEVLSGWKRNSQGLGMMGAAPGDQERLTA